MKKKLALVFMVIMAFALTGCGEKQAAYDKFVGLLDSGQVVEAYEFWTAEGEAIFGEEDYKDIANYRDYVKAAGPYLAGEPVRLSHKISALTKLPSDFLDTADIIDEMDDVLDDMEGKFQHPTMEYYGKPNVLVIEGESFHYYMGSIDGEEGYIDWAVKDGKAVYGVYGDELKFTVMDKGMQVEGITNTNLSGDYKRIQ